jgi:hypothetical protein
VGELFQRGIGADATPWEAASRGCIRRGGVGRPARNEVRNVFIETYYYLSNVTQFTSSVLTAAKAEAKGVALHRKCNSLDARYIHSLIKDGITSCSILLYLPCLGIGSSIVGGRG